MYKIRAFSPFLPFQAVVYSSLYFPSFPFLVTSGWFGLIDPSNQLMLENQSVNQPSNRWTDKWMNQPINLYTYRIHNYRVAYSIHISIKSSISINVSISIYVSIYIGVNISIYISIFISDNISFNISISTAAFRKGIEMFNGVEVRTERVRPLRYEYNELDT